VDKVEHPAAQDLEQRELAAALAQAAAADL
jgi:hypothetical protein